MNKITALIRALIFPFIYLLLQWFTGICATGVLFAVKRAGEPGLPEELLQNRVTAAYRAGTAWFLILDALLMVVFLIFFFRLTGVRLTGAVRFRPLPRGRNIFRLLAVGLGLNLALMGALQLIPFPESWVSEHSNAVSGLSGAGFWAQALLVLFFAPVIEEVLYRGLALSYLRGGFSPVLAVLWQAVLFGAFHGTKLQLIYAFTAGLVLGYVALRFGSATASMIVHMAFNAVSLLISPALGDMLPAVRIILSLAALLIVFFGLIHFRTKKPDWDMDT